MKLRERVERWKNNTDKARVSVPLGELREALAEIDRLNNLRIMFKPATTDLDREAFMQQIEEYVEAHEHMNLVSINARREALIARLKEIT